MSTCIVSLVGSSEVLPFRVAIGFVFLDLQILMAFSLCLEGGFGGVPNQNHHVATSFKKHSSMANIVHNLERNAPPTHKP